MSFQKNKSIRDVYFSGSFFYHKLNEKKGRKKTADISFYWENKHLYIPAYYTCPKGIVIDLCIETKMADFNNYIKKWDILNEKKQGSYTIKERRLIDKENPLEHNFNVQLKKNSRILKRKQMESICYIPFNTDNKEAIRLMKYYKLNKESCWSFYRISFPCNTKSNIKSLSIMLSGINESFTTKEFTAEKNQEIEIIHPLNGKKYILTVKDIFSDTLKRDIFNDSNMEFPSNFRQMIYTISPDIPYNSFHIRDTKESDQPRRITNDKLQFLPDSCVSIGIIGGADGPTALIFSKNKEEKELRTACSSLFFEKQENTVWQFDFYEKLKADTEIIIK